MIRTSCPNEMNRIIEVETVNRDRFRGFAIDSVYTHRPEDVLHARRSEINSSIHIVSSIVEVGLLDREGKAVHTMVEDLDYGADPRIKLPPQRKNFTFIERRPMPCISVVGDVSPETGGSQLEVVRSRVFARRFVHDSPKIIRSTAYQAAVDAAYGMTGRVRLPVEHPSQRIRRQEACNTVTYFASLFNQTVSAWTAQEGIPQLYRHYPAIIQIDDKKVETSLLSATPKSHAAFDGRQHARSSTPCTELETFINMVAITSYLETGESAVSFENMDLIAGWMNQRKIAKYERRFERAARSAA